MSSDSPDELDDMWRWILEQGYARALLHAERFGLSRDEAIRATVELVAKLTLREVSGRGLITNSPGRHRA